MRRILVTAQKPMYVDGSFKDMKHIWEGEDLLSYCLSCNTSFTCMKSDLRNPCASVIWSSCPICNGNCVVHRYTEERKKLQEIWAAQAKTSLHDIPATSPTIHEKSERPYHFLYFTLGVFLTLMFGMIVELL